MVGKKTRVIRIGKEIVRLSNSSCFFLEKCYNPFVVRFGKIDKGGHYA